MIWRKLRKVNERSRKEEIHKKMQKQGISPSQARKLAEMKAETDKEGGR